MNPLDVLNGISQWSLHQGDALAFLRTLPDESVDAVVTDPPYSSGGQFRGDRLASTSEKYVPSRVKTVRLDFSGDNHDQRGYLAWSTLWLTECLRVAKPGAPICVFSDWRQLPTTTDAVQAGGWVWRGIAVWDKTSGARPTLGRFSSQAEYVIWGSKGAMPFKRSVPALPGVFVHAVRPSEKHHIAGKPPALMRNIVRISTEGGVVLDPFAGSATTGVAALASGRRFIGAEICSEHHAIAEARLAEALSEAA